MLPAPDAKAHRAGISMPDPHALPDISLIVPVYNEACAIDAFMRAVLQELTKLALPFEIVAVSDGSTDDSVALLRLWQAQCPMLTIVEFTRNFGKEAALLAGMRHSKGRAVIAIDVDLQHPPALLETMIAKWRQGYDMVAAVREQHSAGKLKALTSALFYKVFNWIAEVPIVPNSVDYRLLDRSIVEVLLAMPERNRFFKAMSYWVSQNYTTVTYSEPQRRQGSSRFRLPQLWQLAWDGVTSFSSLPLHIWSTVGFFTSAVAFLYALIIIVQRLFFGITVSGYASLMVATLFMGGVQLISLGVLGQYIGRLYRESKGRPHYVLRREKLDKPCPDITSISDPLQSVDRL